MYVDELVAPHTVNTMPMATLHAVADHSRVQRAPPPTRTRPTDLKALAEAGIDMSDVTDTLLREGIEKFVEPFDELIRGVESAREAAVTERPPTISSSIPDELEPLIVEHIERSQKEDVVRRIWRKDVTLWAPEGTPEIANRLGWLTISDAMLEQVARPRRRSRRNAGRRGIGTPCCWAWAGRASVPRCCGAASPTRRA